MTTNLIHLALETTAGQLMLKRSVINSRTEWSRRDSLLVRLTQVGAGADARCGLGEVTPLPGYSPDSLDECQAYLGGLPPQICLPASASLRQWLDAVPSDGAPPAAAFGLESALLQYWAAHRPSTAPETPAGSHLPAARLLGPRLTWRKELKLNTAHPAATIKVKVGIEFDQELESLCALRREGLLPGPLRLDANTALSPNALDHPLLKELKPQFFEEPAPLSSLGEPRSLQVPLALDESLRTAPELAIRWVEARRVRALVVKPMTLGLEATLRWVALGQANQTAVIISHLLDGAVAMASYHTLSLALGDKELTSGLGAHPGLALWSAESAPLTGASIPQLVALAQPLQAALHP